MLEIVVRWRELYRGINNGRVKRGRRRKKLIGKKNKERQN